MRGLMTIELTAIECLIVSQALTQMGLDSEVNEIDRKLSLEIKDKINDEVKKKAKGGLVK